MAGAMRGGARAPKRTGIACAQRIGTQRDACKHEKAYKAWNTAVRAWYAQEDMGSRVRAALHVQVAGRWQEGRGELHLPPQS